MSFLSSRPTILDRILAIYANHIYMAHLLAPLALRRIVRMFILMLVKESRHKLSRRLLKK